MKSINSGGLLRFIAAFTLIVILSSLVLISPISDRSYKNISLQTRIHAAKLSFYQSVKDSMVGGIGPIRTTQYKVFQQLLNTATTEELNTLTSHKNEVIKGYALLGLIQKKAPIYNVLVQNIQDSSTLIEESWGCIGGGVRVGSVSDFFVSHAIDRLSTIERSKIDSILFFTDFDAKNDFTYKFIFTDSLKPNEIYYNRLKQLYTKKQYFFLLHHIAEYRNPQDKQLILDALQNDKVYGLFHLNRINDGLHAVKKFPDYTFLPILESLQKQTLTTNSHNIWLITLYEAILAYQPAVAKPILKAAIETERSLNDINDREHTKVIYSIIRKINNAEYDEIMDVIKTIPGYEVYDQLIIY